MIAKFRHEMFFADSLGRKKYRFFKQHYKQIMPTHLQSHPSVGVFYTIYTASYRIKFCKEEITGVQNFIVLCFVSIDIISAAAARLGLPKKIIRGCLPKDF